MTKTAQTPIKSLRTHLEPDGMFMFPLHVIYMPRHSLHRIYGIQHHIIALSVLVKVVFYFLRWREGKNSPVISKLIFPARCNSMFLSALFCLCIAITQMQCSCFCYYCVLLSV